MSEEVNPDQVAAEAAAEVPQEPEAAEVVVDVLENMDTDAIAAQFEGRFGSLGDFGPESVDDLTRTSAYRISPGGEQDFTSIFDDNTYQCRIRLNEPPLLTALSWGQNENQFTGRKYKLIQGQMRIDADIFANLNGDYVHVKHIFFSIFKKFLDPAKVGAWDFPTFEQFCKNAGFPINGKYMYNFELLGAHDAAIDKYLKIFQECGAVKVDRANKPQFIQETFEFTTRNLGLEVTNLEIGGSDPTQNRLYGKGYSEDGVEKVYDNPTFVDPFHAQMWNFFRFMMHYKTSVVLAREAKDVTDPEGRDALTERSKAQRSMATSYLNNFAGVHRAATQSTENEDRVIIGNQYYPNRARCGRFGVRIEKDKVVEMNFWQPDSSSGVAVTASSQQGTETVAATSEVDELAEQTF